MFKLLCFECVLLVLQFLLQGLDSCCDLGGSSPRLRSLFKLGDFLCQHLALIFRFQQHLTSLLGLAECTLELGLFPVEDSPLLLELLGQLLFLCLLPLKFFFARALRQTKLTQLLLQTLCLGILQSELLLEGLYLGGLLRCLISI